MADLTDDTDTDKTKVRSSSTELQYRTIFKTQDSTELKASGMCTCIAVVYIVQ